MTSVVLSSLGLIGSEDLAISAGQLPGRVSIVHGATAEVICSDDDVEVALTCSFSGSLDLLPVAGDWVGVTGTQITQVLPRSSALCRPDPNGRDIQVLASNVNFVLIVVPIDRGLNVRMLERFAIMGFESGATPIIVLTKIDATNDLDAMLRETELTVPNVRVFTTSSKSGEGINQLRTLLVSGVTAVMLGASGAGKTSLLNALEGTEELTRTVGRSGEGRHATTTRKLYRLSSGGVLLDIPGIRLLDLIVGAEGVEQSFADIVALSEDCRFSDCKHAGDLDCAVEAAVRSGDLAQRRLESWHLIQEEMALQSKRRSPEEMMRQRRRSRPRPKQ